MHNSTKHTLAASFVVFAVGFLAGYWPVAVVGILLAALFGRWVAAILFGLILDIAYGAPTGALHVLVLPFTILAVTVNLVRLSLAGHMRKAHRDTL